MDAIEKDYPNLTEMDAYANESHACGIGVDAAELTRVIAEVKTLRAQLAKIEREVAALREAGDQFAADIHALTGQRGDWPDELIDGTMAARYIPKMRTALAAYRAARAKVGK